MAEIIGFEPMEAIKLRFFEMAESRGLEPHRD